MKTKVIREGAAEALGLPPGFAVQEITEGVLAFESEEDADRCAHSLPRDFWSHHPAPGGRHFRRVGSQGLLERTATAGLSACSSPLRSYAILLEAEGHPNIMIADTPSDVRAVPGFHNN